MVVLCILTSGVISTLLAGQEEVKIDQQNSEITRYSPQDAPVIHDKVAIEKKENSKPKLCNHYEC